MFISSSAMLTWSNISCFELRLLTKTWKKTWKKKQEQERNDPKCGRLIILVLYYHSSKLKFFTQLEINSI